MKRPAAARGLVALLTDFGTRDWFVGTLKGVILTQQSSLRLLDITHEIPPQDITAGALTLAAAAPWFPPGTVFLAVVDPGVGTDRALIAACAGDRFFVGPDNGLLALSLQRMTPTRTVRLTNQRYWLKPVSQTFQARDILAPAAAQLARGTPLTALGTPLQRLIPLQLPVPHKKNGSIEGEIIHIDTYGNLITNVPTTALVRRRTAASTVVRYQHQTARVVSSYAAGKTNELLAVVGSLGLLELAVRNGSAAWLFGARRGERVSLTW